MRTLLARVGGIQLGRRVGSVEVRCQCWVGGPGHVPWCGPPAAVARDGALVKGWRPILVLDSHAAALVDKGGHPGGRRSYPTPGLPVAADPGLPKHARLLRASPRLAGPHPPPRVDY
eukprot:SAG31_NODE_4898_length_2878_cov_2.329975_1_plen_117_part_00